MRFLSKQPYYDFRTLLYTKSRKDFEHQCLRILGVVHPGLQQVVESKTLDRSGLDLVLYGPEARSIELGVQCKGFEVTDFRADQLRQCLDSIETLRTSGQVVRDYVLALNRHVDRPEDREALNDALRGLIDAEVSETAVWLDPGAILRYTAERVQTQAEALVEVANRHARNEHAERLGGGVHVTEVPFRFGQDRDTDPAAHVERLVVNARERREALATELGIPPRSLTQKSVWTFVTGEFGFGKTSLLLALSEREVGYPVYLPMGRFDAAAFSNETTLARSILGVLRDRPYNHAVLEDRFVVTNLRATLKSRDNLVLLVDGLDEHPVMYTSGGMERVFSCFADFGPTCVFSVRSEFWQDRAGDLSAALGTNPKRQVVIEMEDWGRTEILEFVRQYRGASEAVGLVDFERTVRDGRYEDFYGDIPRRPLFLRMLVEDAERGETATRSLAELYERYFVRKFVRDREGATKRAVVSRPLSETFAGDRLAQAGEILRVLDRVAAQMVTTRPGWAPGVEQVAGLQLTTEVSEHTVRDAVAAEGVTFGETLELLQHSVLGPSGARTLDGLRLRFAHRSFQEFFLARSILRGLSPEFYVAQMGSGVRRFVDEFRALDRRWS